MIRMTRKLGAELLAEYLGEEWSSTRAGHLVDRFDAGFLAAEWELRKDERSFYESSVMYLFELIQWNSTDTFYSHQGKLADIEGKRVLDFGAGIGTITHQLVEQGNKVYYCDINRPCREFAKWCGEKLKLPALEYCGSLVEVPPEVDIVVAVDVLEHLEDLPNVLRKLNLKMAPDGVMLAAPSWTFRKVYPMHHDWSKEYLRWLEEAGFEPKSQGWTRKVCEL